jgi:RNA polymerase nonessential primary-like sigma factor
MVVRRYTRGYMGALEEMDMVQEGCLGLLDAVRRFDFTGSRGFMTYAVIRIRKSVLQAMEKQQRLVRMPSHMVKKSIYLREIIDNFSAREGRYPLLHEIELETGESLDIHLMLSLSEKVIPLHACVGDSDIPLSEQLQGNEPSPDDVNLNDVLDLALQRLDERSKLVLAMRYGLLDGENQKLSSIAEVIGLSIERTRQIEKSSVKMLADIFHEFHITDWLQWN